jgi:hypothetical protein
MPPLNSRVWRRYGQLRIYVPGARKVTVRGGGR